MALTAEEKIRVRNRTYYLAHPDYFKKYYTENKEHILEYMDKIRSTPKQKIRMRGWRLKYRRSYRQKAVAMLGDKCSNPFNLPHYDWMNDSKYLHIDHINGGGNKEIKAMGNYRMIRSIAKDPTNAKLKYQLLCACCNWKKRIDSENFVPVRKVF